jgi:hypothetical protein
MAQLTYDPTPADQPEFSEEEQDSLRVGEQLEQQQNQMLAGKFENAEQLEKAYLELQQKMGEGKQEVEPEAEAEEVQEEPDYLAQALNTYQETGKLTDELKEQLDNLEYEDIFSALQNQAPPQADDLSEEEMNAIQNYVGGKEQYGALMDWAANTLDQNYVNAFDELVQSGSARAIQLAVRGLMAEYENQNGYEGRMLTGKAATETPDVFRSQAEVVQAMSDPRYDNDPAYRNDVFEKLSRSDVQF